MTLVELFDSASLPPEQWLERARSDGYLFFRGLVGAEKVYALRQVALETADELGWLDDQAPLASAVSVPGIALGAYDDPRWFQFLSRVMADAAFFELRSDDALQAVLCALFAGPAQPSVGDICRVVSGDDDRHTTVPHQDRFYVEGEGELWTAWLPLGECPRSLGPVAVLPGSHRGGLLPHGGENEWRMGVSVSEDLAWAAADLAAGDVLLFSGLTIHRALPHRGGRRLRMSVDYRFIAA